MFKMKSCVKCGNCEIVTLGIDNFWSDWSEVGYDGSIWEFNEEKLYFLI